MRILRSLFRPNAEKMEKEGDVAGLIRALQYPELEEEAVRALGRVGDVRAIDPLVDLLRKSDRLSIRMASAHALGEIADPRGVKALAEVLGSRGEIWVQEIEMRGFGSKLRAAAAGALGRIGNGDAIEALIRALGHEEDLVRWGAISALEGIGKPAVELLIEALGDDSEDIRAGAVRILGSMRDTRAAGALAQALRDDRGSVREHAARALDGLGWQPSDDAERAYRLMAKGDWHGLLALEERAVEPLIWALGYPDPGVRRWAPRVLGQIGDQRAVKPLIEHLRGKTPRPPRGRIVWSYPREEADLARAEAAEALGKIGDPRATEALLEALSYPAGTTSEHAIQAAAREALFEIGCGSTGPLVEALKHSPAVRTEVATILGRLGWQPRDGAERAGYLLAQGDWAGLEALGEEAIEPLLQAIREPGADGPTRLSAVKAAGEIGHAGAVEPLIDLLRDAGARLQVVDAVTAALSRIGPPAVEPLIQALADGGQGLRLAAAKILGEIGDKRAVEPLVRAFEEDEHWVVRSAAAKALGAIGDRRAVPSLIRGLEGERESVRTSAMESLGKMEETTAVEPLIRILLGDETVYIRKEAARTLGEIGDERAVGALEEALKDQNEIVRKEAEIALEEITVTKSPE